MKNLLILAFVVVLWWARWASWPSSPHDRMWRIANVVWWAIMTTALVILGIGWLKSR